VAKSTDRRTLGVTDERAFYYQATGLLARDRGQDMPNFPWRTKARPRET